jgi:hypothetical protein
MKAFLVLLTVFLTSSSLWAHGHAHVGAGRGCRTGIAYGYPATPVVSTAQVCLPAASYTSVSVSMPAPIATQAQYVQQAYVQPAVASYAPVQAQQTYSYTTVAAPAYAAPAPVPVQQNYAVQTEVAPVTACLPAQTVGVSAGYVQSASYAQSVGVAAPAYAPSVGYGAAVGSYRAHSASVVGVAAPVYAVGAGRGVFRQHTVQRGFVGAVGPAYGTGFVAAQPVLVSGAGAVGGVHQGRTVFRQRTVIRTR